jgi:hypothetical protein
MTAAEKIDYSLIPVLDVARELPGHESRERSCANEKHFADHGGLFVNIKKNRWYSHGNATGGDAINLIRFANSCDYKAAFDWLRSPFIRLLSDCRSIGTTGAFTWAN